MGIPRAFRWLSQRYANILVPVKETELLSNVYSQSIDHFYIDMNGLIHPCAARVFGYGKERQQESLLHPPPPKPCGTWQDLFQEIARTVNSLVNIIRPSKSLVLAVDGVAGAGKCISEGTMISMADGTTKPIEEIVNNDLVLAWNGKGFVVSKCLGLQSRGIQDTLKITTYDGRELICTGSHKILVVRGNIIAWVKAGRLKENDHIVAGPSGPRQSLGLVLAWSLLPYYTLPIVDIQAAGTRKVYDIEVACNHSFLANGICVHNCTQQRQRRFRAAKERSPEEWARFDSCQISPGTQLMYELALFLHKWIQEELAHNPLWANLTVTFSDDRVCGEGEHKCLVVMREESIRRPSFWEESHCIHGLDADLIMLTLSSHLPKCYLFRENMDTPHEFYLVRIGELREQIVQDIGRPDISPRVTINDFVLLFFLVGNDFLPHSVVLDLMNGGMDLIYELYLRQLDVLGPLSEARGEGVVQESRLRLGPWSNFFTELGLLEKQLLEQKIRKLYPAFPYRTLSDCSNWSARGPQLNLAQFRERYYQGKLGCAPDSEKVRQVCRDYLHTMQWVASYYSSGITDWEWVYPHLYGPFPTDLGAACRTYQNDPPPKTIPLTPFEQLLSILPPKSRHILPSCFHKVFDRTDKYPTEFEIDFEGAKADWEGVAQLPHIDIAWVKRQYRRIMKKCQQTPDFIRNTKSAVWRYTNS